MAHCCSDTTRSAAMRSACRLLISRSPCSCISADLIDIILTDADLTGAKLAGAYLMNARLAGANLSRANLSGALLRGALLSGATLSGTDLSNTDLKRVTNMVGVRYDQEPMPDNFTPPLNFKNGGSWTSQFRTPSERQSAS
jgi:uncharacterized protein YjbI with pentapeptide repeats